MRSHYEFQVGWRPFQLNPDIPPSGLPRKEYLNAKFGGAERADRVYEAISKAGEENGLDFNFRDVGNQEFLVSVANECGMDGDLVQDLFRQDADRDLVMAEEGVARRMGINGVPCFVVDHKYAISGAQDPSVLTHVFDLAMQDKKKLTASVTHEPAGVD